MELGPRRRWEFDTLGLSQVRRCSVQGVIDADTHVSDEDIPYLAGFVGEDNLISGSDYGHHFGQLPTPEPISFTNRLLGGDPSADVALVGTLRAREDMTPELLDKILVENPRRFYGL